MQTKCWRTGGSAHRREAWPCAPSIWGEKEKVQPKLVVHLGAECRPAPGMKSLCFHLHSFQETKMSRGAAQERGGRGQREGPASVFSCVEQAEHGLL